ncbi:DEAD/DEAH box helicase [Ramlibacter sp. WS9]|uniref:DEAD/DEAH box helicase n=1 Tax=Ramlibacter sp. WS9 TaxID=1882741 RepID=UPI0011414AF6|nr:DEAD/DEAH box helicase [Ramlibacter sp. WS9]ROZ71267.1 DEAD/DEAH box helicase [Ramlibacter sp. WS9]
MTDTFAVQGELSPAESFDTAAIAAEPAAEAAEQFVAAVPNGFLKLGLASELIRAVADLGYTQPTTVQEQTIPLALPSDDAAAGYIDLMVSSQTGSGKTAAFLLPVLHTLLKQQAEAEAKLRAEFEQEIAEAVARGEPAPKRPKRKDPTSSRNFKPATPGALILCPTRELAQQVAHDAIGLVQHCRGLRIASVVGGMPYQLQIARLQNADLVVATPGRLLDLQRSSQIKLDKVQFLVVDEGDRMLDLGFADDLAEVNKLTIERKQTMMFSATFAPRIQALAARVMRQPRKIQIDSPQEKHANIKQVLFWADSPQHKRKLLDHWLRDTTINQAIVFASTQIECDGLANDLQQAGFDAVALHGALSQGLRNRRLMALRQGQVQVLVATDVAARGIDVPTITHVFNYGLPMKAEDYTHRIGRTGRAGRDGLAVTFAEFRDRRKIFDIEGYSKQQFKAETIPGLEPAQRAPQAPRGGFADRGAPRDHHSRDRKFGAPRTAGFGGNHAPREERGFDNRRSNESYVRKPAFGDFGGQREGFAPRGDFAPRAPSSFAKPAKPGNGGKVFVPRDAKKRPYKPAN